MNEIINTSIKINGKEYKVACNKSEVDELMLSAKMLDERVKKISGSSKQKLSDDTLFLFTSLELENLLANLKKDDRTKILDGRNKQKLIDSLVLTIENFIHKVENMG